MKTLTAYFNRFAVDLPEQAVKDCSHQGACDGDVEAWEPLIAIEATPDQIRAELKEYGAWDAEQLADDKANRQRLIWIAAGNIQDESRKEDRQ